MPAAVPYVVAAVAAGASAYNSQQTARKQDRSAADSIRNQSSRQQKIDQRIGDEITKLEGSNSAAARKESLQSYTDQLRMARRQSGEGLVPRIGGAAFVADASSAEQGVQDYGQETAGLLSRIDAPNQQRRTEGQSLGCLGTDIDVEARGARGQQFLDNLRLQAIRRNPWIDAAASFGQGYAGGMGGGAGMGGSAPAAGPYASGYVYPTPRTW